MPKSPWPIWICSRTESASRPASDPLRRRLAVALASCAIIPIAAPAGQSGIQRLPNSWPAHASIDSIYFARGAATIDEAAEDVIQRHVAKLRGTPGPSVTIVAHTRRSGQRILGTGKGTGASGCGPQAARGVGDCRPPDTFAESRKRKQFHARVRRRGLPSVSPARRLSVP